MNKVSATDTWLELALIPSIGARHQLGTGFIGEVERFLEGFAATAPVPGVAQGRFPSVHDAGSISTAAHASSTSPPTDPPSSGPTYRLPHARHRPLDTTADDPRELHLAARSIASDLLADYGHPDTRLLGPDGTIAYGLQEHDCQGPLRKWTDDI